MLLGMVIDNKGLVPEMDARQLAWFGEMIGKILSPSNLLGETSGRGLELTVELKGNGMIGYIILMEEIAGGERILEYNISGWDGAVWKELCAGNCVGHKRIHCLKYPKPENMSAIKLACTESKAEPIIRRLAVYKTKIV
jgi:hypothetical protein